MSTDLGIECGASHSVVLARKSGGVIERFHFGPGNYKLKSGEELQQFFQDIHQTISPTTGDVGRISLGMAGVITEQDINTIKNIINSIWTSLTYIWVGSDAEIALACIQPAQIRAIVVNGTGSNCFGVNASGITVGVGGFGHVLGDRGSAYEMGLKGLRGALKENEYGSPYRESKLFHDLLQHLGLSHVVELVDWSLRASKPEIAALGQVIVRSWRTRKNSIASKVVNEALEDLYNDTRHLLEKLSVNCPDLQNGDIKIGLTGSVFAKCPEFSGAFMTKIRLTFGHKVCIEILDDTTPGAFRKLDRVRSNEVKFEKSSKSDDIREKSEAELAELILPVPTDLPPTEVRNPRSMTLDKMPIEDAIDLMLDEENSIHENIRAQKDKIGILIERITMSFKSGGRLIYVGAGTSGRLGVLDASECPPTFKAPPHWVQGIIAGGRSAAFRSIEGAEDSIRDGMIAIDEKNVNNKDVVIGIAACGRTPFVWGSLYSAKSHGAYAVLLSFNPNLALKFELGMFLPINCGPEVLTGSTRLKSGSATKVVLNMLTTLSMVQYGKVLENLMVDLMPSNNKLKDRAFRIVSIIIGESVSKDVIYKVLLENDYNIKETVKQLRSKESN